MSEPFWFARPAVLFDSDRWYHVVPTPEMPLAQKLNCILRATAIVAVLVSALWRDARPMAIVPIVAALEAYAFADMSARSAEVERFLDESGLDLQSRRLCAKPTPQNPFMNVMATDFERPNRPSACRLDGATAATAESLFQRDMPGDATDVYSRISSSRQFYTMPSTTIPNDQAAFANFLYGDSRDGCKSGNGNQCYRNRPGGAGM